jgi:hypothetical protein
MARPLKLLEKREKYVLISRAPPNGIPSLGGGNAPLRSFAVK